MRKIEISDITKAKLLKLLNNFAEFKNFSRSKKAYEYTSLIGVRVCPYCNINYVYTVYKTDGTPVLRADLDHIEAQCIAKKRDLDVLNLVPCCQQCNSRLKHMKTFADDSHVNPLKDSFDDFALFAVFLSASDYVKPENFDLELIRNPKADADEWSRAEANIQMFRLRERYQHHKEEAARILRMGRIYGRFRRNEIAQYLRTESLGQEITYLVMQLMHVAVLQDVDCDINQTSLGKLKQDVVRQYLLEKP